MPRPPQPAGPRRRARLGAAAAVALGIAAAPGPARGCASCACGDPTLTAMGVEKPFRNRARLALEERLGAHTSGEGDGENHNLSLRSTLSASWSPHVRVTLSGQIPLVLSWLGAPGEPARRLTGLGDAEVAARALVYRDRAFSPRHLLSVLGGLKLPTGPRVLDAAGYPFPEDDQPGSGSADPLLGVGYAWFGEPLSVFSSVGARIATRGRNGTRAGSTVGATWGAQAQPLPFLAVALALDLRWGEAYHFAGGAEVPNTGGTSLAVSPSIFLQPVERWLIRLSGQLHVYDRLAGQQSESHALVLSTVVDVN